MVQCNSVISVLILCHVQMLGVQLNPLFDSKFHFHGKFWINLINLEYHFYPKYSHPCIFKSISLPVKASVAQLDALSDCRPGGRRFNPRRGRQHSFVEIDHEIFSTVILSLPLIQIYRRRAVVSFW